MITPHLTAWRFFGRPLSYADRWLATQYLSPSSVTYWSRRGC